ncbi:MAG: HAMP domain-containing sensor histidine kinase [Acidimicrobiia bacterium]
MRRRIVGVAVAVTAMVVIAFAVPLALTVRNLAEQAAVTATETVAASFARDTARNLAAGGDIAAAVGNGDLADGHRGTVVVGDETFGAVPSDPSLAAEAAGGAGVARPTPYGIGVALPIAGTDGSTVAVVVVEGPDDGSATVALAWGALAGLSVLLVGLSAVVADRLAAGLVRSVDDLAAGAEALAAGDLDARVDPSGPPEVATVAEALNRLGGRITALLRSEREEVADLAHRLRTPLTALRLEVEGTPAESSVLDLSRAVDEVITEARRPLVEADGDRCDLVAVVRDRVRFWEALADDEGRRLEARLPAAAVPVRSDARSVGSAIDALVGNVFQHTEPGTPLRVTVETDPAALVVEDGGPGLPHPDVVSRGSSPGGSTGLGLDIARRTVEAAGGSLEAGRGELGGATIRLRFD